VASQIQLLLLLLLLLLLVPLLLLRSCRQCGPWQTKWLTTRINTTTSSVLACCRAAKCTFRSTWKRHQHSTVTGKKIQFIVH
jgi:hypothetical protein